MTTLPLSTRTPTGVWMIGYLHDEDRPNDEEIQARTLEIAKAAGIEEPDLTSRILHQSRLLSLIACEKTAGKDPYQLVVKALLGYDYCVYMLILSARDDDYCAPLTEVAGELERVDLDAIFSNDRQFDVEVYTGREVLGASAEESSPALFGDGSRPSAMSRWQGLPVPLVCAYWSHLNRYVLIPAPPVGTSPLVIPTDHLDRVISQVLDDLARLEVYHHKLRLSHEHYCQHYDAVEALEIQASEEVRKVRDELENANIARLRRTLDRISERFVDLSRLAYATQYTDYAANANRINLERQLQNWDEALISGYPPVSHLFLPEARQIAATLGQFSKRIEGVRTELDSLVQIIRIRVELSQQQELIEMQHAMNVLEFLVLAGILFPFLQEVSSSLEQVWGSWAPAWMPRYGDWLPVVASLFLSLILLLIFVPVIDRIRDHIADFITWIGDKIGGIT